MQALPLLRISPGVRGLIFPLVEVIQYREANEGITKWAVELMRDGITYEPWKAMKSQILANFIPEWTKTQLPPP